MPQRSVPWSSVLRVRPIPSGSDKGDRIVLPSSVLPHLLDGDDHHHNNNNNNNDDDDGGSGGAGLSAPPHTPHTTAPYTFELTNEETGRATHAGVLEFSAQEGTVCLPRWMWRSLDVAEDGRIAVRAKQLPKGTWAQLQPLSEQYRHIRDYRAAFEAHLRACHTTLTVGETIAVPYGADVYEFRVRALKPADAIVVVDTDLTVELEGPAQLLSSDDRAREHAAGTGAEEAAPETTLLAVGVPVKDRADIRGRRYYRFVWRKRADMVVRLSVQAGDGDYYVSILDKTPDLLNHTWSNWAGGRERSLHIAARDPAFAENETYFIGVHAFGDKEPFVYTLLVDEHAEAEEEQASTGAASTATYAGEDAEQCARCLAMVPAQAIRLHRGFCERNNVRCEQCGRVTRAGEETDRHWHCRECDECGDIALAEKHRYLMHRLHHCTCGDAYDSAVTLARHRATDCAERLVHCRYCRNLLPRGKLATEPHSRLMGLTEHEAYCGGRTITCAQCQMAVRLHDVKVHMQLHDAAREQRPPPFARCRNDNCTRARADHGPARNVLDLCEACFGPLWSSVDDPDRQKLVMRVARRYHLQLMDGCEKHSCHNEADSRMAAYDVAWLIEALKQCDDDTSKVDTWLRQNAPTPKC
ncbi:ubiquitin fusion degradation protein UFD1-domain-containing protein [Syncephalis pseudoplumigaleata]|uniref:Ubiquitin fusion degradation protein UFD1-domain-containing protein n=1 Tax=Syncephalis pseudoplumigaleata TaxID=1712513 RepID=A0A4P9Z3M2_9FUNG|nr:ubiquitin fusion degradation protein UFD1-domain-containing protein [Syncephalis pseudoplumigaleata]|eukprot:RKP27157.1 ubiquitin fusion degradation protein UFD1-domain-containing protein [Syncephalis pseudoplumigaleata]